MINVNKTYIIINEFLINEIQVQISSKFINDVKSDFMNIIIFTEDNTIFINAINDNIVYEGYEDILSEKFKLELQRLVTEVNTYNIDYYNKSKKMYIKNINISGDEQINNYTFKIEFNYNEGEIPDALSFNLNQENLPSVYGICGLNGIINYSTNNGIFDESILKILQSNCIAILKNYDTL